MALASLVGPKKSRFQGPPLPIALVINHYVHINNRYRTLIVTEGTLPVQGVAVWAGQAGAVTAAGDGRWDPSWWGGSGAERWRGPPPSGTPAFIIIIPDPDFFHPGNRIRITEFKYFNQCCGSWMFIPDPGFEFFPSRIWIFPSRIQDPNFFHPGSEFFPSQIGYRIRIKKFKYFNPKKTVSKLSEIWSELLFIPDPDPDFLPISDPGSRGQKGTGSRFPDPEPQHWFLQNIKGIPNRVVYPYPTLPYYHDSLFSSCRFLFESSAAD